MAAPLNDHTVHVKVKSTDIQNDRHKSKRSRGSQCCVALCGNFQYMPDGSKSDIHLFQIPQAVLENKKTVQIWCNLIKRQDGQDNFTMKKGTVMCSEHFRKEDIKVSLTHRMSLKEDVMPSIFLWTKVQTARKTPEDRLPLQPTSLNTMASSTASLEPNPVYKNTGVAVQVSPTMAEKGTQTKSIQHQYSSCDIEALQEKISRLETEISDFQDKLDQYEKNQFSVEKLIDDSKAMLFYTGFQNYDVFQTVFNYLEEKATRLQYWRGGNEVTDSKLYQTQGNKPGRKRKLSLKDEFFMVLLRLKVGLFVGDIAERFNISQSHFSKVFTTWINFLYHELPLLFPFPSQELIRKNMPKSFRLYPTTSIILDCTEIFVEVPSFMLAQSETWSNYKHHNTYKILVGVSPNGVVTFVSDLWGGRASDKEITRQSGILNLLEPGDNVMCDRGFEIDDILPPGVTLNIPPFKGKREQLIPEEETMKIASVRIHVERAIGRIKNFHILDGVMPLSLKHVATQLFTVISYLTNILPPLVPPARFE